MEPINCTARVGDGKVEVWVPTQVPGWRAPCRPRRRRAADAVTVHVTYLGAASVAAWTSTSSARRCASPSNRRPAGAAGVVARGRHRPRLLSPAGVAVMRARLGEDGRPRRSGSPAPATRSRRAGSSADCRPRRPGRHARQDHERGPVRPALRDPQPAHRPRRDAQRRAGRLLALGRPLAQRLLQRVVHRRARDAASRTRSSSASRC